MGSSTPYAGELIRPAAGHLHDARERRDGSWCARVVDKHADKPVDLLRGSKPRVMTGSAMASMVAAWIIWSAGVRNTGWVRSTSTSVAPKSRMKQANSAPTAGLAPLAFAAATYSSR